MKLQVWSLDFAISLVIFFSALVLIIFSWNYTSIQAVEQREFNNMQTLALEISDSLIRTTGIPADWDLINVKIIGLASNENILNSTKIEQLLNLDYDKIKQLLVIANYEFYFELDYLNNTIIEINGNETKKGLYPSNANIIVPTERYCLYDEEIVKLKFILWNA